MRGTRSCSTTSACLPRRRRIWQQARAEPMASPSGRACEVSTKRSRCSMCFSTSFNMALARRAEPSSCASSSGPATRRFSLRIAANDPNENDSSGGRRRCRARPVPGEQNRPRLQAFQSSGWLHRHFPRLRNITRAERESSANETLRHIGQPNARIAQFSLDDGFDLLAQGFAQAAPDDILPRAFPRLTSSKTNENIRKSSFVLFLWMRQRRGNISSKSPIPDSQKKFNKRVRHIRPAIVGDAGGLPFHIFHQSIEIVARIGNTDHPDGGLVPQVRWHLVRPRKH